MKKKVIIVGGGFAGILCARQLKSSNHDITLVDKTNYHLFQPLLYQVATAALSPGDIAFPIRGIFTRQKNIKVILGEVTGVNPDQQKIFLKNGDELGYDYLVLAPGARFNYFGNKDWESHAGGLKTLSDALDIRERILLSLEKAEQIHDPVQRKPYLTYVVVGGGPTGVEMAGSIAEIAKRNMMRDYRTFSKGETQIHLLEAGGQILNGFDDPLPEKAQEDLEKMGVNVLLNSPVQKICENGVLLADRFIETPNIIWAAGVKASPLMDHLNAEKDQGGRVIVNKDLSVPGYPNLFVAGDSANVKDEKGKPLPGLAPVAMQQGRYLGQLIRQSKPVSDRKPFHYVDKGTMATIGRAKAIADIRGIKFRGFIAWLMWGLIHIFFLMGFRNRFRVFAEWLWHYLTFKRGVRLIAKNDKD